jgi:class 3 adenylate cyclase/pSer/pThr/pTyr-binding forkhead associated (FHA) protein
MSSEPNLAELLKEWAQLNTELERHQRLVTVMFTDIAGSTRYFDEYGDLAGMAMLTAVNDRLQPLVTKHKGTIVKTIGDAIMAYFENPRTAVGCSIEMQRAVIGLDPQETGKPIQIRVALNLGVGLMKDNDVFGDVVNVCSRIEHKTPASRIGVSPSVVEAIGKEKDVRCRLMGTVELRGKAENMDLYEVLWREEDLAAAEQPAAPVSTDQLEMATGTIVKVGEDVRAAIAAALKGKKVKAPVSAAAKQFVLVEEKPGGELGRSYPLVEGRLLVGREKGDLLIDDDSMISAEHALFTNLGGALYVEDVGSTHGVFVRLREPFDLQDGNTILMGREVFRFHLTADALKSTAAPGQSPVLAHLITMAEGEESGQKYPLRRGETILGRMQGDITFPENMHMSRRHARIKIHASYAVLTDLGSTNGTFARIRGKHLLDVDDRVMFGRQVLRVVAEPVP